VREEVKAFRERWRKQTPAKRAKSRDWVARFGSIAAVIISIATIYLTYFYRTERLSLMVLNYPDLDIAEQGFGFTGNVQLAFFNYGNTPIVITNISISIRQNPRNDDLNCSEKDAKDYYLKLQPFVVKPGEDLVKAVPMLPEMDKMPFVGASMKDESARFINTCLSVEFVVLERIWSSEIFFGRWGVGKENFFPIPSGPGFSPEVLIDRVIPLFDWMYRGFP
jgi:hypothetical protein